MLDYTKTKIKAGNGGKGTVGFRREKYVPKGGPDGGDGGHGGDIYIEASNDISTLLDFQFQESIEGQSGEPGGPSNKRGKDGQDIIVKVPVGSVIKINKLIADVPKKVYGKRNQGELKQYEQKLFNYKKLQKLKNQYLENQELSQNEDSVNLQEIIDDEQPITSLDQSETANASKVSEGTTDDLLKLDHTDTNQEDGGDSFDLNNIQEQTRSQSYKIYKFSAKERYSDNTESAQIDQREVEIIPSFDLNKVGQRILIARGGKGGRGNARFKSSTNQAPKIAEPGQMGEYVEIEITLKMMANVGIIGYPNAGKSTLLSKLTAASPKIANYPFTTLEPNLGVMYHDDKSIVLADIPGLIEGASEGRGLGFKFLQHVERTQLLMHVIEIPDILDETPDQVSEKVIQSYTAIREELSRYGRTLPDKQEMICINKIDKLPENSRTDYVEAIEKILKQISKPYVFVSAQDELGLNGLKKILYDTLVLQAN
jgi:GTP-binding protein